MRALPFIAAAALAGVAFAAAPASLTAAPLGSASKDLTRQTQTSVPTLLQDVQARRGGRVGRGGRGGGRVGRGGRGGRGGGGNFGAAAAGAAIGLAIGIMASEAARQNDAVEYCIKRYRSYNPQTGTWIDRHGRVHRCP